MNMLDDVLKALAFYHGENSFNMNPHVPVEIEHYARAVLDIPDEDYVLAAMRLSFTKFHKGLVFAQSGVYWRNAAEVPTEVNHLTWKELNERKKEIRVQRGHVSMGEGAVFDNSRSLNKPKVVINQIDLLLERYVKQAPGSDGFIFDKAQCDELLIRSIPQNKAALKEETIQAELEDKTESLGQILLSIGRRIIGKKD